MRRNLRIGGERKTASCAMLHLRLLFTSFVQFKCRQAPLVFWEHLNYNNRRGVPQSYYEPSNHRKDFL